MLVLRNEHNGGVSTTPTVPAIRKLATLIVLVVGLIVVVSLLLLPTHPLAGEMEYPSVACSDRSSIEWVAFESDVTIRALREGVAFCQHWAQTYVATAAVALAASMGLAIMNRGAFRSSCRSDSDQ